MLEHKIHIDFETIWIFAVVIFIVSNLRYLLSQSSLMTTLFARIIEFHRKWYNNSLTSKPAIRSLISRILYMGIPFSIYLEICSFSCHKHKYTLAYSNIRCTFIMTLSTTCCLLMTLDVFIYSFVHFCIFIIIRFSFHNYNVFSQNRQRTLQFIHAQAHTKMSFGCHETNISTLISSKITYDKTIKFCIFYSVINRNAPKYYFIL